MSRQIEDPDNLTADDVLYIQQRPWLVDELEREGFDLPSDILDKDFVLPDSDEDEGYAGHTVKELQTLLKERELPTDGKKDELVARLEANDAENDDSGE